MSKKNKFIVLFLFLLVLFLSIFLPIVLKDNEIKISQPVLNSEEEEENIAYYPPGGACSANDQFHTWKGMLFFLFYSFLYGLGIALLIRYFFKTEKDFFPFLVLCFYSFFFPAFFAFGNYKEWTRFYSWSNVRVMIILAIFSGWYYYQDVRILDLKLI